MGNSTVILTGDDKLEILTLRGRTAFIWPLLAFLRPFLKSSGSQLSADPKKSEIGWNMNELQAKTWKSTKIQFGRNGEF